jgi:hypothetical protein
VTANEHEKMKAEEFLIGENAIEFPCCHDERLPVMESELVLTKAEDFLNDDDDHVIMVVDVIETL